MIPDKRDEYAQIVENEPILRQTALQEQTAETDYGDDVLVFYSSGENPKMVPYSRRDQERAAEAMARTFRLSGMDEDDVVLNLGAPAETNHQSGWGITYGSEAIGATVINESVQDFDADAVRDRWEDVTVVMSLPRMLHALGEKIEAQYGDLDEQFPNAEIAITSGDIFPDSLRDRVNEQWGFDTPYNFYAGAEMSAVAGEERARGDMIQTSDELYLELLDPDAAVDEDTGRAPEDAITPVYDVDEPTTGPVLISAPERELLPFIRYRVGDVLTAVPADDEPRLIFEGREDRVINLSGCMVYPREIDDAVYSYTDQGDEAADDTLRDWRAVATVEDDYPVLNMHISGEADEDFAPYLAEENGSVHAWYDSGAIKIRQQGYESADELAAQLDEYDLDVDLLADDQKATRVGFDASYREAA